MGLLPHGDPVLLGIVGSTAGGVVGVGTLIVAFSLRLRSLPPFGFKRVSNRWLLIAVGLGFLGYGLNLLIQFASLTWFGASDPVVSNNLNGSFQSRRRCAQ